MASHNAFANGQAINRNNMRVNESALRGAHVTNGVNATPTHASYLGATKCARPRGHAFQQYSESRSGGADNAGGRRFALAGPYHEYFSAEAWELQQTVAVKSSRGVATAAANNNHPAGFNGSTAPSNNQTHTYADRPPSARPQGAYSGSRPIIP